MDDIRSGFEARAELATCQNVESLSSSHHSNELNTTRATRRSVAAAIAWRDLAGIEKGLSTALSIRNLKSLFAPGSIALIGASERPDTVGAVLAKNLLSGGFQGPLMLVNPHISALNGQKVWPDVDSLPSVPELAVIATPPATVPDIVAQLGAKGTKAAIVITAGFGETGEHGLQLQQAMLDAARPHLLRILGPNCFGIVVPDLGLNTSFGRIMPGPGRIALVSQSGAINAAVSDWACARGIGFSHLVSLGGMADTDFGDVLDYLASDPVTEAILLYVEGITNPRKFMSAARAASRSKPVIAVKSGRSSKGAAAAASHTGALAGADDVYDAAFRRAGMLRVHRLEHLFEAVETLSLMGRPAGPRLGIISNGGGLAVMAADAVADEKVELAVLAPATLARLDGMLPATWSHRNPVDVIGDATAARYTSALEAVIADDGVDAVLVIHCPTAIQPSTDIAAELVRRIGAGVQVPVFASWAGGTSVEEGRARLSSAGVANFATPEEAVRAFSHIVTYQRNQDHLLEAPPAAPGHVGADRDAAQSAIGSALAAARPWLDAAEAFTLMRAYSIPVAQSVVCADPDAAAAAAATIGGRVALKIVSPDILHKSDVGGVILGLEGPAQVRDAAATMFQRLRKIDPPPRLDGFLVQAMVERPRAHSLLVGMMTDPTFGPVIVFGHGGTAVEVIADRAIGLPPLNMKLAHEMMERTRIHRLLKGYRDVPAADDEAIAFTLVKLSRMIIDNPQIQELDLNPLLADETGVIAVDVRVRIAAAKGDGDRRLAIRPYPREFEESIPQASGGALLMRPILPEDGAMLARMLDTFGSTPGPQDLVTWRALAQFRAPRATQIDYDREMALVLLEEGGSPRGIVRISADPDNEWAAFALAVPPQPGADESAALLLGRMISCAYQRGIGFMLGEVIRSNARLLTICRGAGFTLAADDDNAETVRVVLNVRRNA